MMKAKKFVYNKAMTLGKFLASHIPFSQENEGGKTSRPITKAQWEAPQSNRF